MVFCVLACSLTWFECSGWLVARGCRLEQTTHTYKPSIKTVTARIGLITGICGIYKNGKVYQNQQYHRKPGSLTQAKTTDGLYN